MKNNPLEDLFNYLKSLGQLKEYSSYKDYRQKKYGADMTDEEKEEQIKEDYEQFKKEMPAEELKQYNNLFGE